MPKKLTTVTEVRKMLAEMLEAAEKEHGEISRAIRFHPENEADLEISVKHCETIKAIIATIDGN